MLAPLLVELFNRSLAVGVVQSIFKSAYISTLLKKADLDPAEVKSYIPISHFISTVEVVGTSRLTSVTRLLHVVKAVAFEDYTAHHTTDDGSLESTGRHLVCSGQQ